MTLRWEPSPGGKGEWAWRGEHIVGQYGQRDAPPGRWWYSFTGVNARWISKSHGEVASAKAAKAAVERCWRACLDALELEPREGKAPQCA